MGKSFESEIGQLEAVSESLADAASELVSDAIDGETSALRQEREVEKARRAVEKAISTLKGISSDDGR